MVARRLPLPNESSVRTMITPLILTYNEECNIDRTLRQLGWADEVLIVDSCSTDRTREIAAKYPRVRILQRKFDDHASQWNFGLEHVKTPWVLTMDADYVLSDALINELQGKLPTLDKAGYYIKFRYCVAGKPLPGSIYPPRLALFQTKRGHFILDGHTQKVVVEGDLGFLDRIIYHDDRKPLSAFLRNQDRYETLEVEKLTKAKSSQLTILDRARRTRWLAPVLVAVYCLFWKRLIFEGRRGLFYTLQRVYTELLLSIKLLDRELQQEMSEPASAEQGSPSEANSDARLTVAPASGR